MPTVFSHAVIGLTIATVGKVPGPLGHLALVGARCAAAPDLGVFGLWFGIPRGHPLGHRAVSRPGLQGRRGALWLVLFLAAASHGILDAMTDGSGVAFFAPFDDTRYFLPWRPIPVSPMSPGQFCSRRGVAIMQAETLLLWLPAAVLAMVAAGLGGRRRGRG